MDACRGAHTYIYTYAYTYIHTYTYIYIYLYKHQVYMMVGRLPWMKEEARTFDGLEKQKWARDRQLKRVFESKRDGMLTNN